MDTSGSFPKSRSFPASNIENVRHLGKILVEFRDRFLGRRKFPSSSNGNVRHFRHSIWVKLIAEVPIFDICNLIRFFFLLVICLLDPVYFMLLSTVRSSRESALHSPQIPSEFEEGVRTVARTYDVKGNAAVASFKDPKELYGKNRRGHEEVDWRKKWNTQGSSLESSDACTADQEPRRARDEVFRPHHVVNHADLEKPPGRKVEHIFQISKELCSIFDQLV